MVFQCVRHEVALCLLKCQKHRVLQKRCSSRPACSNQSLLRMVVPSPVFQHVPNSFDGGRCYFCLQFCGSCHHSGSKSKSKDMAERRGPKTWPEGVVGRRGRKAWPERVVGKLALGFELVRLSLAVPWCEKKPELQDASQFTVSVGCLEEVSRFQTQAMSCCCCVAKDMGLSLSPA